MKIAVIGTGGWGTANAILLSGLGHEVSLWGRNPAAVEEMRRTRSNPVYLPDVAIPNSVRLTSDRAEAVRDADVVAFAVPSRFIGNVSEAFAGLVGGSAIAVSLTKGFCERTCHRMSELIASRLGVGRVAVLSGPSHAEEVARGIPTAIVAAAHSTDDARVVQRAWSSSAFRVYTSDDLIGVEVGGAVKNVIAIAVGCSDGLGYGDNTRAALITRGLAEISRFACACGANPRTVSGLSGMGDLIVTCTSRHSRNRAVGERLGRGEGIDSILSSMKMVAEGVWNSRVVRGMAADYGVAMPITEAVYGVCHEGLSVRDAITSLMNRPLKDE